MLHRVAYSKGVRGLFSKRALGVNNLRSASTLFSSVEGISSYKKTTSPPEVRTISGTKSVFVGVSPPSGTLDDVAEIVKRLASIPQTSVSLQALMRTGRGEFLHKTFEDMQKIDQHSATNLVLIQVASFLRRELPIRLAHRIQDLEGAPIMGEMSSVQEVKELYITSLMELVEVDEKITTSEQEEEFSKLVERIYERHGSVLVRKFVD